MDDTLTYDHIKHIKRVLESMPPKRVFFFPMAKMAELVYEHWDDPMYRIGRKKISLAHLDIYFSSYLTGEDGYEAPPQLFNPDPKNFLDIAFLA